MSHKVEQYIEDLIKREGGYVDHPADRGGKTTYGITEAVARLNGYKGDMKDFPKVIAEDIYLDQYWEAPKFNLVEKLSPTIAEELFDTGVLMGQSTAAGYLQRSLNLFNKEQATYPDLKVDGQLGVKSLTALGAYLDFRKKEGELVMMRALNSLQGTGLFEAAERRQQNESFSYGWFLNRVVI